VALRTRVKEADRYGPGMARTRYVALLRGINVGGRNPVAMAALRTAFEDEGYGAVSTYIQSGNVLFDTDRPARGLEDEIEAMLERRLGLPLVVVVRSHRQLRSVVDRAPAGFGAQPKAYHSDVLFLKGSLTPRTALASVQRRDGVDQAWPGTGVLYFARLSARRTQSRMSTIAATPAYKLLTIRSWSTTTKLLDLLDEARATR
jgi:uncharacterized protein (DUF1697 family)